MTLYNLTTIAENATSLGSLTKGVNSVLMYGYLGVLFIFGIAAILFLAFFYSTGDPKKAFAATSFISFALSLMLRAYDLLPDAALVVTLAATAISVAIIVKGE